MKNAILSIVFYTCATTVSLGQVNGEILNNLAFGRYATALELINQEDDTPVLLQYKAMAFEGLNMYDSAISCYTKLLQFDERWAQVGLARCYENNGNPSEAIKIYVQVLSYDSLNTSAIIRYANLLRNCSLHGKALPQYLKLVDIDSTNFSYWEMLGDQYKKMGMEIEATTAYYRSYSLNAKNLVVATKYFNQQLRSNIPLQFIYENILDAYKIDSTYLPILMLKGKVESDMKSYKKAEESFTKIASLGDSSFFTLKNLAVAKHLNGSYLEAEKLFSMAYEIDSTDYFLNFAYAKTLNNVGERTLALEIISKTIEMLYPPNQVIASFYELMGDIYSSGNQIDLAEQHYLLALEKDKNNELTYLNKVIWCKLNTHNFREADRLVSKYDSIVNGKYANDSNALKDEKRKINYYKHLIKNERFFNDDL